MSHREKSLTPWITNETHGDLPPAHFDGTRWSDDDPKTDREKHEFCRRRTGVCATFLSPSLYAKAESLGYDMRNFVINKSIPVVLSPGEISLDNGKTWEISKLAPSHAVRWDDCRPAPKLYPHGKVGRKHISEKTCGDKDVVCMPGLDGKCVACSDDD